jgi:two-component system LytT family response regulator
MSARVLIVDDEAPARRKLRGQLARHAELEIAGEAANGLEAVEAIRTLKPDVVFLDVQMPGMTGFEVIEAIGTEAMPAVVFVTAYDEFALDAFDVAAADYLLKPASEARLKRAVERALERNTQRDGGGATLARVLAALRPSRSFLRRIVVRTDERLFFVNVAEIVRLSAEGNYVKVHTGAGAHLIRETLASLESKLDPERFARVHRSDIVNVDWVKEIQPHFHGDAVVVLKNGESVRLSRRYQDRLLRAGDGE